MGVPGDSPNSIQPFCGVLGHDAHAKVTKMHIPISLSVNERWDNACSNPGIWLMKVSFMSSALICAPTLVDAFLGALLPAILCFMN